MYAEKTSSLSTVARDEARDPDMMWGKRMKEEHDEKKCDGADCGGRAREREEGPVPPALLYLYVSMSRQRPSTHQAQRSID